MIEITIRQAAQKRGIEKPHQLAKSLGLTDTLAARLWNGSDELPKLESLDKLCEAWGCPLTELVRWTPNGKKKRAAKSSVRRK